jgi:hypothetical protein
MAKQRILVVDSDTHSALALAQQLADFGCEVVSRFATEREVETGIGIHHYFGDVEPFWSVSLPLLVVARPLVTNDSRFLRSLRINFGANIFAPLDNDAFEPVTQIPETGFEWVWTGFVSLDFPIGR